MNLMLLALSTSSFAFFISLLILTLSSKKKLIIDGRVADMTDEKEQIKPVTAKKKQKKSAIPVSRVFENELAMAAIKMKPQEFLILWLIIAVAPCVVLYLLGIHVITIIAAAVLGIVLPIVIVRNKQKKELLLFEKQLVDALMLIGNGLRSGLTFQQALGSVAKEMEDPIAREFSRVVKEIKLGSNIDIALNSMLKRVDSTDLMLVVSAVQIQHQVGGNLIEILTTISSTISDRQKLKKDIRVMTASGRTSGVIVGLLPLFIGGILMLINPEYIQTFFNTKLGTVMLVCAGVMECVGYIFIKKTITIKY